MQGMSERKYAAHAGLSKTGVRKAKATGRLVLHDDGSIDAAASDMQRAAMTDPAKSHPGRREAKPVPEAALGAVAETLCDEGEGEGITFMEARTANEILKAQERRLRLQQAKGELIPAADVEAAWAQVLTLVRTRLLGIPDALAPAVHREESVTAQRNLIRAAIREALDELADTKVTTQPETSTP